GQGRRHSRLSIGPTPTSPSSLGLPRCSKACKIRASTMPEGSMKRLRRGAAAMLSGIAHVHKDSEVRRAYRFILLALFGVTLSLNFGGSYAVWHYTRPSEDASLWVDWGMMLLRLLGILATLLVAPVIAITTCNLLFPVF